MLQRIFLVSIMLTCFLWTGTFLHDVDQLDVSLPWFAEKTQVVQLVYSHHHHGHFQGHGHSHHTLKENGLQASSTEVIAFSDLEIHGHDPLLQPNGLRNISDSQHLPVALQVPYYSIDAGSADNHEGYEWYPRPPPEPSKIPIYLFNRAILI